MITNDSIIQKIIEYNKAKHRWIIIHKTWLNATMMLSYPIFLERVRISKCGNSAGNLKIDVRQNRQYQRKSSKRILNRAGSTWYSTKLEMGTSMVFMQRTVLFPFLDLKRRSEIIFMTNSKIEILMIITRKISFIWFPSMKVSGIQWRLTANTLKKCSKILI